jgi:hypothetical protein
MAKLHTIKHQFVEFVPDQLEPGILYISVQYKTMAHLCCCGCGKKVVTPISPTGWELTFNGRAVSISPSVGNWNLQCQSHYVISNSRVQWAGRWSKEMIAAGFARDRQAKQNYYNAPVSQGQPTQHPAVPEFSRKGGGLIRKIKEWWSRTLR